MTLESYFASGWGHGWASRKSRNEALPTVKYCHCVWLLVEAVGTQWGGFLRPEPEWIPLSLPAPSQHESSPSQTSSSVVWTWACVLRGAAVNQHVFFWLTVGARARASFEFEREPCLPCSRCPAGLGGLWKSLGRFVSSSSSGLVTGLGTGSCPTAVSLVWPMFPVSQAGVCSSKWVSPRLFLTCLHSTWVIWSLFGGQHGHEWRAVKWKSVRNQQSVFKPKEIRNLSVCTVVLRRSSSW